MPTVDRRVFLQGTGLAVASMLTQSVPRTGAAEVSANVPVPQKDPRMIVHVAEPPVLEAPAALLADQPITPTPLVFVRNCQPTPQITGADPLADWSLELSGLVNRPQTVTGKVLRSLPKHDVEMVVQCSGNGRAMFAQTVAAEGMQWDRGGMACVRFGGVRLASVLDHLGVKPQAAARFITAEGRDRPKPGKTDFEHSLPLDDVLKKSLLVWELNGEPLPIVHGGPLRLVTPGYYGTMQIKWVERLRIEDRESDHESHIPSYRTPIEPIKPGSKFEPTYTNSDPNWRMRLKSVILTPTTDQKVSAGKLRVSGVAFNDGEARIDSVLISTDRGATWRQAEVTTPDSPYAWYVWHAEVELPTGKQEIWSRAFDALGRTQPLDGNIFWNQHGYTWNGVEKIPVIVG
jgi:sulfite oxidase